MQPVSVSSIIGDLTELSAAPVYYELDLPGLKGMIQDFSGHVRLGFNFNLESLNDPPVDVLIAQPIESPECMVAVEPDISIFLEHAAERFGKIPRKIHIISDNGAIRAYVRVLQKLGVDSTQIYSTDINRYSNGRTGVWTYDSVRSYVVAPDHKELFLDT